MKIPSVFRRLFAEGAFNQAFIPVLSEYKEGDKSKVKDLINNTFGVLTTALLLVSTLALLFAPFFVMIFAPGFYAEPLKKVYYYYYFKKSVLDPKSAKLNQNSDFDHVRTYS